jgi:cyclophilin family peptidyl-prolyl cis-trans isomerase
VRTTPGEPHGRTWVTLLALGVLVASLIGVAVGVNRVAGSNSGAGVPTPTAATTPTPTATGSPTPAPTATPNQVAFADCSKASFSTPLAPLNAPTDLHKYSAAPPMTINAAKLYQLTISTAKGTMVLCLQPSLAPTTTNLIVTLARNHFYDGLKFHRVVPGFVVQGGDPQGTGSGGPGFSFADEPVHNTYVDGALAMANSGPNTNGSQFFICLPAAQGSSSGSCSTLPHSYNLFGKVQSGLDVAAKIAQGDVMDTVTVREQA